MKEKHIERREVNDAQCKFLIQANEYGLLRGGTWFAVGDWNYRFLVRSQNRGKDEGYESAKREAKEKKAAIFFCVQEANSYSLPVEEEA